MSWGLGIIEWMAALFVLAVGLIVLLIAALYVIDRNQTQHALRRNYPVIARFRYLFEHMGEFFRQYFFAQDREELPFNRAQRSWAYRAAKKIPNTVAFGSTRDLRDVGTALFVAAPYPMLEEEKEEPAALVFGPNCRTPYATTRHFHISGMSFGAISKVAIQALSKGAAGAGCWMNTGEGGLSRYHLEGGCDIVFQMGTAKYGVRHPDGTLDPEKLKTVAAHEQVRMFEVKLSQGAKPGKGGILPAEKVTGEIAETRGIPVGKASLSPNRHPEVKDDKGLLDMIAQIRAITGKPVGVKTVISGRQWLVDFCRAIQQVGPDGAPDFITIDGADGGTGAAPMPLIDSMGLPVTESLPMTIDVLREFGLRERIRVIVSGKLITPTGVALAFCAGADAVTSARGFMFSLGCIQALQCNRNTCPTGITTHDPNLQKGLVVSDKAGRVEAYQRAMEKEIAMIAHSCGVANVRSMRRHHVRLQQADGRSRPYDEIWPDVA